MDFIRGGYYDFTYSWYAERNYRWKAVCFWKAESEHKNADQASQKASGWGGVHELRQHLYRFLHRNAPCIPSIPEKIIIVMIAHVQYGRSWSSLWRGAWCFWQTHRAAYRRSAEKAGRSWSFLWNNKNRQIRKQNYRRRISIQAVSRLFFP